MTRLPQVLTAAAPPPVPTVMIVAGKAQLLPVEGIATVGDLEGVARHYLVQAGQARDLGARESSSPRRAATLSRSTSRR